MTEKFPLLYVKPAIGSRGIGIMQIKKNEKQYVVRTIEDKQTFDNVMDMYQHILSKTNNKEMIIQQGIVLEKVNQKPYDIRIMVQRRPKGKWTCTGIFCKVGSKRNIVTNVYQGGELWTTKRIFKEKGLSDKVKKVRLNQLKKLGIQIANTLSDKQEGMYQMGVDVAIDHNQNMWVLEINSHHPAFYPMKKLNKKTFDKMMEFARSYGRTNP